MTNSVTTSAPKTSINSSMDKKTKNKFYYQRKLTSERMINTIEYAANHFQEHYDLVDYDIQKRGNSEIVIKLNPSR